jgi:hypothetical protein
MGSLAVRVNLPQWAPLDLVCYCCYGLGRGQWLCHRGVSGDADSKKCQICVVQMTENLLRIIPESSVWERCLEIPRHLVTCNMSSWDFICKSSDSHLVCEGSFWLFAIHFLSRCPITSRWWYDGRVTYRHEVLVGGGGRSVGCDKISS